jgi:hypothetical protein
MKQSTNKENKINAFINSKKSANFWLILILLDVLLILFFGYLIYKSVFATDVYDNIKLPTKEEVVVEETIVEPEVKKIEVKQEVKQSIIVKKTNAKTRHVIFRYWGEAREVAVVGGFTMRKPWPMKYKGDYWETAIVIYPGTYRYLFIVDGETLADPYARTYEDGKSVMIIK